MCRELNGTGSAMLQLSEHLRTVIDGDGAVLLDVRQGKIIRCNQTGATILELLSRRYDQQQLAAEFSRLYEISLTSADADVRDFLSTLESHGLLRRDIEGKSTE